ncbi:Aste57867_23596 [Aphanomyces stellatus]|uniref:Aste57867_23596 protein n=1 Tax=Aphanomyces stellatus TaxID=120398 RepID=A0A485LP63_9STRA|nr:hypothetical protein As57867_023524 [Aphanomyces stellatus]VFU00241.1 Aste57867_23596 [Aphanomyces stellatus]
MEVCSRILSSPDLGSLIFSFQNGVSPEMSVLQRISNPNFLSSTALETLDAATAVLGPWLASNGLTNLPGLLDGLAEKMKHHVALYCLYAHDTLVWEYLLTHFPTIVFTDDVICFAAKIGSLDMVRFFHASTPHDNAAILIMEPAACNNQLGIVQYFFNTILINESVEKAQHALYMGLTGAALHNHVQVVEFLFPFCDPSLRIDLMRLATFYHKSGCVPRLLLDQDPDNAEFKHMLVHVACDQDQVDKARQLFFQADGSRRYSQLFYDACFCQAVVQGSVKVATLLAYEVECHELHEVHVCAAAAQGHLPMLHFLRELKPVVSTSATDDFMHEEPLFSAVTKPRFLADVVGDVCETTLQLVLEIVVEAQGDADIGAFTGELQSWHLEDCLVELFHS